MAELPSRPAGSAGRPVAVVGVSCRLPGGVGDLSGLWEVLEQGRDVVGEVPADRFDVRRFVDASMPRVGKSRTAAGGFLDDVAGFDAGYFGIAPKEASRMDPQHRLLLELAVEALDDAGIAPARLAGSDAAVFVGVSDTSYGGLQMMHPEAVNAYTMSGGASSIAANRLSHFFDLRGPSMVVDTACSSSLVALDRACRTLWDGTSAVALCGGVNVLLSPYHFVGFSQAAMLSPTGRCAAFSAAADGFVRAEGGGVVVLKPAADAVADGDRIHGLILGTGTNSDGRTMGLALPSARAQEELLRSVYERAGVGPDELVYLEAHGTGTPVGDPVECQAIGRALGRPRTTGALPIGSAKTNFGHLEPASGIVGLLKALLVLRHRTVPPTLHATPAHPDIDFDGLNITPAAEARPTATVARPVVGVNSFGFGGSNAHVALTAGPGATPDGEPAGPPAPPAGRPLPLVVSARTAAALAEAAAAMVARLEPGLTEGEFYDIAYTACRRRGLHPHRLAVLATVRTAVPLLRSFALPEHGPATETEPPATSTDPEPALGQGLQGLGVTSQAVEHGRVAFVFPGNGSQWAGMAADLLESSAAFRAAVAEADEHLSPLLGWSPLDELAAPPEAQRMSLTRVAQPLLFVVQVGLTRLLREQGITPYCVLGHSVGEVAAAHVAGALDLGQAARVVAARSARQADTAGTGRMAAVALGEADVREALADHSGLEVAAVNSGRDVTVAGPSDAVRVFLARLAEQGVAGTELDVDHAFHSAAMDPVEQPLREALADLRPAAPAVPMISTVTGEPVGGTGLDAAYWWRNVREPVAFAPAVERALDLGADILLEVGPHPVLSPFLRRVAAGRPRTTIAVTGTLRRGEPGAEAMGRAVATLLAQGADPDWRAYFPRRGAVADLPAYPWQRERHWNGTPHSWLRTSGSGELDHPLLGERMPAPWPTWQGTVEPVLVPWLADHRLAGSVVVPATAYVEMALAAGRLALDRAAEVDHLEITRPLVVPWADAGSVRVQLAISPDDGRVHITSTDAQAQRPRPHVRARVRALYGHAPADIDVAAARARCRRTTITGAEHYESVGRAGLRYGPGFRLLDVLHVGDGEVLAAYRHQAADDAFSAHPALLDAALQAGAPLLGDAVADGAVYLPAAIGAARVWHRPAATGWAYARRLSASGTEVCWDVLVTDDDGRVSAELRSCRLRRLAGAHRTPVTVHHTVLRAVTSYDEPVSDALPPDELLTTAVDEPVQGGPSLAAADGSVRGEPSVTVSDGSARGEPSGTLTGQSVPGDPSGTAADGPVPGEPSVTATGQLASGEPPMTATDIASAAASQVAALRADWRGHDYPRFVAALKKAAAHCYAAALAAFLPRPDAPFTAADLLRVGTVPRHATFLSAVLPELRRHRLVGRDDSGGYRLLRTRFDDTKALRDLILRFPRYAPEGRLALHGLRVLRAAGDHRPVEHLLSDGGLADLEQLYDTGVIGRFHNRLAQALLRVVVERWPDDRPLRVLEVGAGTGGTTAALLPLLPPERTRYVFTDVSPAFLTRAEHRFAAYDFLTFRTLDLDADPAAQGLPEGGFDVVVAANALHTARSVEAAVRNVAALAAPNGLLLAVESHDPYVLAPLFGALDTFWDRTDHHERPHSPLLTADRWAALFTRCGFTDVVRTGDDTAPCRDDFSVLLATAPRRPTPHPYPYPHPSPPGPGRHWTVVAETGGELPLAREVAARLPGPGDGPAHSVEAVDGAPAHRPSTPSRGATGICLILGAHQLPEPAATVTLTTRRAALLRRITAACPRRPDGARTALTVVTRPSGALPPPERPLAPEDAAVWGVMRTLANEEPELDVRTISLDRTGRTETDARRLARELLTATGETEVALTRSGGRFAPRELPLPAGHITTTAEHATAYALEIRTPGLSYRPAWVERAPEPVGPGEVAIDVRAAALNYRDIMQAVGLLPAEADEGTFTEAGPGLECAGVVTAVGDGVTTVRPGDRVFALAPASLASRTRTVVQAVGRMPHTMSFAEAATLPVVYTTVHYSLHHLARLRPGETVLVHGGAGGVGLAALRYAHLRGARVIATAGTPAKRELLRHLGADHVLDSRGLDFAAHVRDVTDGRGVDVVVNSLAGEAITRGLELLRPGGRFVELGKRDIYENQPLLLRPFRHNLAFFGVDLTSLAFDPDQGARLFAEVTRRVHDGSYRPLPHSAYPAARVAEAFRLLQHSRHVGKVLVTFDPLDEPAVVERPVTAPRFGSQGTYLVTGGTSGFGAAGARWLADRGVRRLALVSRRGPHAPEAAGLLADLAARGVTATAYAADAADPDGMRRVIRLVDATGHPVDGVLHCAMHLDDDPLADLTDERFAAVLTPKTTGAAVLERLLADRPLETFLLYSSDTTFLGNIRQAAYVAANLHLEALARQRRQRGLPAQTLAWGAIDETGYVARNDLARTLTAVGIEPLSPREALTTAGLLISQGATVAGVGRYNWARLRGILPLLASPRCASLLPEDLQEADHTHEEILRILATMPYEEAARAVAATLARLMADVLHLDERNIDHDRRLDEYGLDSLMLAELLVSLRKRFDIDIPPLELLRSGGTITDISHLVLLRLGITADDPEPPARDAEQSVGER
ncbi:type I polyketide synthase [Streptomyces mobaraensis]|uniref:SDR family NAD(P)-dependent oxidoreductase n=1 Tax=Streptomyces mobaraensis TaxID=35621 RepID=A0A5N5W9I3_STRMB|nr:type I polyketide synthase [Streptomyces mobaraensis]KAB7846951.1 SDR family NAD(P)-dependent oxidoreductase [Streptomyces mobaraensis]